MKRTRETIHYRHPDERKDISGCTFFDGEDHSEEQRKRQMQQQQREWLQQQMEEKKQKQELEKKQNLWYDQQRMKFAQLQNQQAEAQFKNLRDMTKASMQTNVEQQSYKKDYEFKRKTEENQQDQQENQWATQIRQTYVENHTMQKYYVRQ